MNQAILGYVFCLVVLSSASFVAFGIDKHRAQNEGSRIPEKTLLLLALFGGWPGALLGQRYFRHKTKKISFRVQLGLCIAVHCICLAAFAYWFNSLK